MTTKELIELLQDLPPETEVLIMDNGDYYPVEEYYDWKIQPRVPQNAIVLC